MIPLDFFDIAEGWNKAHEGGGNEAGAAAPSLDQFDAAWARIQEKRSATGINE